MIYSEDNMIPEALQPKTLLVHPRVLGLYLRDLAAADPSTENIKFTTSCILEQVHTEAIPPSVFEVWLPLACQHSWDFIATALQDPAYKVRHAAIELARRRLFRGSHWKERGWDVLGGAQGIKDILDKLPLAEARVLLKVIVGHCHASPDRKLMTTCVEELLKLVENTDPWVSRSLLPQVSFLFAFCSAEKVEDLLRSQSTWCSAILSYFPRCHTPLLRRMGVGALDMPGHLRLDILRRCRSSLLRSKEAYIPVYHQENESEMSPGLLFGLDLLMAMEKEPEQYSDYELGQWVDTILTQGIREKTDFKMILLILNQGFAVLQASALTRPRSSFDSHMRSLSQYIVQFWSISRFGGVGGFPEGLVAMYRQERQKKALSTHQASLQQCLIQQVLKKRDQRFDAGRSRQEFLKAITKVLSLVAQNGRLEFLQLLCQHSPSLGFDLTAWPPSKKEQELMPCWDLEVLHMLPPDDSRFLFSRSLHNHHCEEFLPSTSGKDPSSNIPTWEAQCLLWATWESIDPKENDFPITRKALGEIKQKAVRAREFTERLLWAELAIKLAVRTNSVNIFAEILEWSKRFIRDPLVFPALMKEMSNRSCGIIISCEFVLQKMTSVSKARLLQEAQIGHRILEDLLKIFILLLREPWARSCMGIMTGSVSQMLSTMVGHRLHLVRRWPYGESVTGDEVVEILLDSLIPILINYEREGMTEGQENLKLCGVSGIRICDFLTRDDSNLVELSFMDRLAKARDELWKTHRARTDPNVLELRAGWPRGLPVQNLVDSPIWLLHAMKYQDHAPFLSVRANQLLFSTVDVIMDVVTKEGDCIHGFVDDLGFVIQALLANPHQATRICDVRRVWEYYSQILGPHPVYLGLFKEWLVNILPNQDEMAEAINMIQQPSLSVKPMVSAVPTGSEVIEWDPHEGDYPLSETTLDDDKGIRTERPHEILCTILNYRMGGKAPQEAPFVRVRKPQSLPEPLSIWSPALLSDSQHSSNCLQNSVVLAALLFLDTYAKTPRILRTKFPNVEFPRYTPIYLADEFIAFQNNSKKRPQELLKMPIDALKRCANRIPSQILRNLIWSFLDTLKAEPNTSMYSALLFSTFDLIGVLLRTDKPQLAIGVMIRVWKDFPNESSLHRKISLVKLGRVLIPEHASEMMRELSGYVCNALHAQQSQQETKKDNQSFIKVTTAKMLAQALADADFLPQSDQIEILQRMFNSTRHIDIRSEIVTSLLELVGNSENGKAYEVFVSLASSVAGPNERANITEAEWDMAERQRGPLPYVAPVSERPMLGLVVYTAALKIPEKLRSDYVRSILLPLLRESTRQHMRWMAAMSARLGLAISSLNITEQTVGPFSPDLVNRILWTWMKYLPGSYLQEYHRPWALGYLQYESFSHIEKALAVTTEESLKEITIRDHWNSFLDSQRSRPVLYSLDHLLPVFDRDPKSSDGLTAALVLEEFIFRAEVITTNPVKYNGALKQYTVCPEYALDPLRALKKTRVGSVSRVKNAEFKAKIYHHLTDAMTRAVDVCEHVRKEGWSTNLTAGYPVTLPSNFEYEILMLPSPTYNPEASESNSAVDIFTSAILDLICRYSRDPILLLKFDSLKTILQEVPSENLKDCALSLGNSQREEHDPFVMCLRAKLACFLLDRVGSKGTLLDVELLGMIDDWKKSNLEIVRQIGWGFR